MSTFLTTGTVPIGTKSGAFKAIGDLSIGAGSYPFLSGGAIPFGTLAGSQSTE